MEYARVRVREKLLPMMEAEIGPGIADALTRSAKILRDDADALDQWAEEVLDEIDLAEMDPIEMDIETLANLPRAIRSRVIRKAIYLAGAPSGSLSAEHLEPVEALVTAWKGQGAVSLPGGVTVARISGRLSLS
jgi:tRNA(Ile)-lysidine synthase